MRKIPATSYLPRRQAGQILATLLGGSVLFLLIRPAFAAAVKGEVAFEEFVANENVPVGSSSRGGRERVYFVYRGSEQDVSSPSANASLPDSDGRSITYRQNVGSTDHIFLYDFITKTTTQLSTEGHNTNPQVSEGRVVWESFIDGAWQVFFFDGLRVKQLTHGDLAINPLIRRNQVVFARKDSNGEWRAESYDITGGGISLVGYGRLSKHPRLENDEIVFGLPEATPSPTPTETATPEAPTPSVSGPSPTPDLSILPSVTPSSTPTPSLDPLAIPDPTPLTPKDIIQELTEAQATPTPIPTPELSPTPTPEAAPQVSPTPTTSPAPI